jgi:hypothetical protein
MRTKALMLAGVTASLFAVPAVAHHSYAMFDHNKLMKISGTVTEWEYVNPHSWLRMNVTDAAGKTFPFGFETRSPQLLTRLGITRDTMKPGDKVTVSYYPLKDGSHGGEIRALVLADGKEISYGPSLGEHPNYGY